MASQEAAVALRAVLEADAAERADIARRIAGGAKCTSTSDGVPHEGAVDDDPPDPPVRD